MLAGPYLPIANEPPHVQVIAFSSVARYGFTLGEKSNKLAVAEVRDWERSAASRLPHFVLPDSLRQKRQEGGNKRKRSTSDKDKGTPKKARGSSSHASSLSSLASVISPSDYALFVKAKEREKRNGIIPFHTEEGGHALFPEEGGPKKREGSRQRAMKKIWEQGERNAYLKHVAGKCE